MGTAQCTCKQPADLSSRDAEDPKLFAQQVADEEGDAAALLPINKTNSDAGSAATTAASSTDERPSGDASAMPVLSTEERPGCAVPFYSPAVAAADEGAGCARPAAATSAPAVGHPSPKRPPLEEPFGLPVVLGPPFALPEAAPTKKVPKQDAKAASELPKQDTKAKARRNTSTSDTDVPEQEGPYAALLRAAGGPSPEAEKAAAWIGSCKDNVLKADPQLKGDLPPGCQCGGRLPTAKTAEADVSAGAPKMGKRGSDGKGASMGKTKSRSSRSSVMTSNKKAPVLTEEQKKRMATEEEKLRHQAKQLEKIGGAVDECNQQ